MTKPVKNKILKTKCTDYRCSFKGHGDQICEAIRMPGSTEDQSICYIAHLCPSFYSALDSDGRTALHTAALVGKNKVVLYLIAHGADINHQDELLRCTPLHFAVMSVNLDTALILLKYGADSEIMDQKSCLAADYMAKPCKILLHDEPPALQAYSWGTNANYTLGLASGQPREFPEHFDLPLKNGVFLTSLSMNKFHTLLLTTLGTVFACGYGFGGRLGFETAASVLSPQSVPISKYSIVQACAGVDHSVFLTRNKKVLTCGMNNYHQLGFHSTTSSVFVPQVLTEWHSKFSDVFVQGVAAAPFHTVLWSSSEIFCCGLNIGQLGLMRHQHEVFIDIPQRSDFLRKLNRDKLGNVDSVATSDGAVIFSLQSGAIFAFYDHEMHRIFSKVDRLKKLACIGGITPTSSGGVNIPLPTHYRSVELKVGLLLSDGDLFIWSKESTQHVQVESRIGHLPGVFDFCLNTSNVCVVNMDHEVTFCRYDEEADPSQFEKGNSTTFTNLSNKGPNILRGIQRGKKIVSLYRTHSVYCDPQGNNYISLQYDPRLFQKCKVAAAPNTFAQDIASLFTKLSDESSSQTDVVLLAGCRRFPAHAFVLSLHSEFLQVELLKLRKTFGEDSSLQSELPTFPLQSIDPDVLAELLQFMYTGECPSLNNPQRFTPFTCERGVKQWRENEFVVLHQNSDNDGTLQEFVMQLENLKEISPRQGCDKKLRYPLKVIKDASCHLKMKHFQDKLLYLNSLDKPCLTEEEGHTHPRRIDSYTTFHCTPNHFPLLHDVAFRCEDGYVVQAHKFILMARSSYFEAMLGIRWNRSNVTELVDISIPSSFLRVILDFLYTNESTAISHSNDLNFLCQMLVFSHQFLLEDLHHLCQRALSKCLTLKNAVDMFKLCLAFDADQLKRVVIEFLSINMPYYFDSRQLKSLKMEMLSMIGHAYRRIIGHTIPDSKFWHPLDDKESEICSEEDVRDPLQIDIFDGFSYSPPQTTALHLLTPTNTEASFLPSLVDLERAVASHPSIASETPQQWFQNRKETGWKESQRSRSSSGSRAPRKSQLSPKGKQRKRVKKKRSRKFSSSSLVSSSSEYENAVDLNLMGEVEPFSFEDLQDRLTEAPTLSSGENEGLWKVVGKMSKKNNLNKGAVDPESGIEGQLETLRIENWEKDAPFMLHNKRVEGKPFVNVGVISSSLYSTCFGNPSSAADESSFNPCSFPTLGEAVSRSVIKNPSQIKRMPKMNFKSGKKSKKVAAALKEEPKCPDPVSPTIAWGVAGIEDYTPLDQVMRGEIISPSRSLPEPCQFLVEKSSNGRKVSSCSVDTVFDGTGQKKSGSSFGEDGYHWNPVTKSVIETPKVRSIDSSFSSIMQEEISCHKHLEKEKTKPLYLIQLEERAICELFEFYGGEFNPEERVTVMRYGNNSVKPSWNVQYRNV